MSRRGIARKLLVHLVKKELKAVCYRQVFNEKYNIKNGFKARVGLHKRKRMLERILKALSAERN